MCYSRIKFSALVEVIHQEVKGKRVKVPHDPVTVISERLFITIAHKREKGTAALEL